MAAADHVPGSDGARGPTVRVELADCMAFLGTLDDGSVDAIVTDPAYSGMNQHLRLGRGRIVGAYAAPDNDRWFREFHDEPDRFRELLAEFHRVMRDDRHLYVMFDSFSLLSLGHIVRERFQVKNLLVWDKVNLGMGHYYRRRHEHIIFASKGRRPLSRRDMPDVIAHRRILRAAYPTQKPVALFTDLLRGSVEPGFVVCDPFVGSGSVAVAALRLGCDMLACDVSPDAVEMTRARCERVLADGVDPLEVGPGSRADASSAT